MLINCIFRKKSEVGEQNRTEKWSATGHYKGIRSQIIREKKGNKIVAGGNIGHQTFIQ